MTQLSDLQLADVARRAGFSGGPLVDAITVALAESGGRTDAVNVEGNHPPSRDRGLWQVNDYWHPEVSDAEAFNADANAAAAYRISRHGTDWTQWSTWQHRAANPSWPALVARAHTAVLVRPVFTLRRVLRQGMTGDDVRELQAKLGTTRDGLFGPVTREHVVLWQQGHHIAADGIVGQITAHSMGWHWAP